MSGIKFRLSRRARIDLERIADYLGERSPEAAEQVLDTLLEAFECLGESPLLGIARDDLRRHIRMYVPRRPAHNYVLFYYPLPDGIEVSDVIHSAQDWVGMFQRGER